MTAYILRRLLITVFLVFTVATLVFLLMRVIPGDIVDAMVDPNQPLPPDIIAERRRQLGLDQPVYVQYVTWMWDFMRGNWGVSPWSGRPVWTDIMKSLPRSLELIFAGAIVAWLVGIPLGVVTAINRGKWLDTAVTSTALLGLSVPIFVTGTMLILVFALQLRWLPAVSGGFVSFEQDPARHLQQLILPSLALGLNMGAVLMQMTRAALLEVLQQDYIRTARAKGLREVAVNFRHALKNALIPVVTVGGLQMGSLLGGMVIIEYIFVWPGLSTILISSVQRRDYPMVQATVFLIATAFILITLLVDVINAYLDPRIRYE